MRATMEDHLFCFRRYSGDRFYYVNVGYQKLPGFLRRVKFDIILFTHMFCNDRGERNRFDKQRSELGWLRNSEAFKIAMPQDEFQGMEWLCDFINDFRIDCVLSVAQESEWPKIYRTVDFKRVTFRRMLTGYLDPARILRITELAKSVHERPIDIGYRSGVYPFWGKENQMKMELAHRVAAAAPRYGLKTDIKMGFDGFLKGDDWFKFLLKCKYTIGVEGGASLLDWDGSIRKKVDAYCVSHPGAAFEEIEADCFAGLDGCISIRALSPRHLEACLTRTCQVLIEGEYNKVLTPGTHYIELKRNFSNLDEVLELVAADEHRKEITENAYADIVQSKAYSYPEFVRQTLAIPKRGISGDRASSSIETTLYGLTLFRELLSWAGVWSVSRIRDGRDYFRRAFSKKGNG